MIKNLFHLFGFVVALKVYDEMSYRSLTIGWHGFHVVFNRVGDKHPLITEPSYGMEVNLPNGSHWGFTRPIGA